MNIIAKASVAGIALAFAFSIFATIAGLNLAITEIFAGTSAPSMTATVAFFGGTISSVTIGYILAKIIK